MVVSAKHRAGTSRKLMKSLLMGSGAAAAVLGGQAVAAPLGPEVVHGTAAISQAGNLTQITTGHTTVINWEQFNIAQQETVQFVQPSASSRVGNFVTGDLPSTISGTLLANGQVYIVNPAGVYFTQGAVVNVGGLYAAAGTIAREDFVSGVDRFSDLAAPVVNLGQITAQGNVVLAGASVANHGTIVSRTGIVTMAAGDELMLGEAGSRTFVKLPAEKATPGAAAGVENTGGVTAEAVSMVASDVYGLALKQSGDVRAARVELEAHGGRVAVSGTIDASDAAPGGVGGDVTVVGDEIAVYNGATIDASGDAGGGTVRIGGDIRGGGGLPQASVVAVSSDSTITADALGAGDGGSVVVWSAGPTGFYGTVSARGGEAGGDGGFVEVSGKYLDFAGAVDTAAPAGHWGQLLLDPDRINITLADNTDGAEITGDGTILVGDSPGGTFNITAAHLVSVLDTTAVSMEAAVLIDIQTTIDASGNTNPFDLTLTAPTIDVNSAAPMTLLDGSNLLFDGDVQLLNNLTITTGVGAGNIEITGNVNADAAANNRVLTLTAGTGNVTIGGGVGNTEPVQALTVTSSDQTSLGVVRTRAGGLDVTAATSITLNDNISTDTDGAGNAGPVDLTGPVILGNNLTIDTDSASGSDSNATFESTVNGAFTLEVQAGGANLVGFQGGWGTTTPLTGLTVTSANDVTVNNAANDFTGTTIVLTNIGNNVMLSASGSIEIGGPSSVAGDLTIAAQNNGDVTDSGSITVTGSTVLWASGGNVVLDDAANDFGVVQVNGTTFVDVTLVDANAIDLAGMDITGNLDVTAGGNITDSGDLLVDGTTTVQADGNSVTLDRAGNDFGGAFSVGGATTADVTIVDASATDLGALDITGNLGVTSGGNITDSGDLLVDGTTTVQADGNSVTLDRAGNDFGGAIAVGGTTTVDLTIVDSTATDLGALDITGNLDVTSGGDITDSGDLLVDGTTTVQADNNSVTLDQAGNDFGGAFLVGGALTADVTIVDSTATDLGGADITGNLGVTSGGNIADSGNLLVDGTSDFDAGTMDITLDQAGNDLAGAIALAGANADITNSVATVLGLTNLTGNLDVTSGGDVTDSAAVAAAGTTTINIPGFSATLDNAGNDFGTVVVTDNTAVDVTLVDADGIDLGAMDITGSLSVTAGGNISDSGDLLVDGTATVQAGGNNVTLDQAGNDFGGAFSVGGTTTANVTVVDVNALELGAIDITGDLAATAGAALTQSAAVLVDGTATLTAPGQSLNFNNAGNDFGTVVVSDNTVTDVTLVDVNGIDLGAMDILGNLDVTAGGDITDSGNLLIDGTTTVQADGNNVALDQAGNDFGGAFIVGGVATADVTVVDANAIDLGGIDITGNLAVTGVGITDSADVLVDGTTLLTGAGGDVVLDQATNDFGGGVTIASGNNVTLRDANDLTIAAVNATLTTIDAAANAGENALSVPAVTTTGTQDYSGNVTLNGDLTTTNSDVTLTGATAPTHSLGGDVTVDTGAGGGSFVVTGTLNADSAANNRVLVVTAGTGDATFNDDLGDTQGLQSVTVSAANPGFQNVRVRDGGFTVTATTATTLNGNISTDTNPGGNAGPVDINGDVLIGTTLSIDADHATGTDGSIELAGNIDEAGAAPGVDPDLTLNAGSADVHLGVQTVAGVAGVDPVVFNSEGLPGAPTVFTEVGGIGLTNPLGDLVVNQADAIVMGSVGTDANAGVAGDLDLEFTGSLRLLGNNNILHAGANLTLAEDVSVALADPRLATIFNLDGAQKFETDAGNFIMGRYEKLVIPGDAGGANGNLTIEVVGGTTSLADVVALGTVDVTTPGNITFLRRPAAGNIGVSAEPTNQDQHPNGADDPAAWGGVLLTSDDGVDVVANIINFHGSGFTTDAGPGGPDVVIAAVDVGASAPGAVQFDAFTRDNLVWQTGAANPEVRYVFDLVASGLPSTSIADSLAGVIPQFVIQSFSAQTIDAALQDELAEMSIFARELLDSEVLEMLSGRGVFDDTPGMPRELETRRDLQVAVARMDPAQVRRVVGEYRQVFKREVTDVATGQSRWVADQEQIAAMRDGLQEALVAFNAASGGAAFDGSAFRIWLNAQQNQHPVAAETVGRVTGLLEDVSDLGLTELELEAARRGILSTIRPAIISPADFDSLFYDDGELIVDTVGNRVVTEPVVPGQDAE